ncbi:MAG TPA: hypothetical protein PLL95_16900 [Anaerolineales bacterium]|nr:hypothetical protein [Anaerolineales bacterium]
MRKILPPLLALLVVLFLAFQPIFPYISELREYSQEGESLHQVWQFVSLPDFYAAARFAKVGWLETTWNNYLILGVVNHVGLILVFFVVRSVLNRIFLKK